MEAAEILAMPCYLILYGVGKPCFPTTTRTHPSRSVVIIPNGRGASGVVPPGIAPNGVLPVTVDGVQWNRCVVPVLESDTFIRSNLATWSLPPNEIIDLLGRAIGGSFESNGYGPYSIG